MYREVHTTRYGIKWNKFPVAKLTNAQDTQMQNATWQEKGGQVSMTMVVASKQICFDVIFERMNLLLRTKHLLQHREHAFTGGRGLS